MGFGEGGYGDGGEWEYEGEGGGGMMCEKCHEGLEGVEIARASIV
jgi:hypothetical protein